MEVTLPTDLDLAPDFNVCVFHRRVFAEEAPRFIFGDKTVFLGRAQISVSVATVDPVQPQWYVSEGFCIELFRVIRHVFGWLVVSFAASAFWPY